MSYTITFNGLSNKMQALLMLLALDLPPVSAWMLLGFPSDKVALGLLGSSLIGGVLAFIKEIMGSAPPTPATPATK